MGRKAEFEWRGRKYELTHEQAGQVVAVKQRQAEDVRHAKQEFDERRVLIDERATEDIDEILRDL